MLSGGVKGRCGEPVVYDALDEYAYSGRDPVRLSVSKDILGEPPEGTAVQIRIRLLVGMDGSKILTRYGVDIERGVGELQVVEAVVAVVREVRASHVHREGGTLWAVKVFEVCVDVRNHWR